ncbi:MAG: hypothetical protein IJ806_04655 [Ruminococcus sp.]|nr:hypothetical protein [Ruminococcus sp.]
MLRSSDRYCRLFLLLGTAAMLLCGVSDCLLSYMGEGEPYVVKNMVSADIVNVPLWHYSLSFFIGIPAAVFYYLAAGSVCRYIGESDAADAEGWKKAYRFGTAMMSVGIFGIHSICCMALMGVRAALLSGADPLTAGEMFAPAALIPFAVGTVWQTAADIISGAAYIAMVVKGVIPVPKKWLIIGPLSLFVITKVLGRTLTALTGVSAFTHWLAGGESWGIAFMFLSVLSVWPPERR